MEAGILAECTAQKIMVVIQKILDQRGRGSDERGENDWPIGRVTEALQGKGDQK